VVQATKHELHINIQIDSRHYQVDTDHMTGAQLLALAGAPAGNQLFRELPGSGDDQAVRPDEVIELRSGTKFYTVPVGNFG
jgi:hypothetical protein